MADVEQLFRALTSVHPRSAQVLMARFFWRPAAGPGEQLGRLPAEFAAYYGITPAAADVLVFRAATEFLHRLKGRPPPSPVPDAQEAPLARGFGQALEGAVPPGEFDDLVLSMRALQAHARELSERLRAAEQAELASPGYARETWLRRLAIVVVLAVSAWFYWKDDLTRWWRQWRSPAEVSAPDSGR